MLNRIAAILLLSVLLFNWLGYRFLTTYLEDRASTQLEASLDDDRYDPTQLVLLRVSAESLPYSNCSSGFQRSYGYIEVGTTRYRMVKKRLYNDSIEMLCIPDGSANQLRTAKDAFFQLVNDLQKPGHTKFPGPSGKTNPLVNQIVWCDTYHFPNLRYLAARAVPFSPFLGARLSAGYSRIGLQPPRQEFSLS